MFFIKLRYNIGTTIFKSRFIANQVSTFSSCKKSKNTSTQPTTPTPSVPSTTLSVIAQQICNGQNKVSPLPNCIITLYEPNAKALMITTDSTGKFTLFDKAVGHYQYNAMGKMSTGNCVGKQFVKNDTFYLTKNQPVIIELLAQ